MLHTNRRIGKRCSTLDFVGRRWGRRWNRGIWRRDEGSGRREIRRMCMKGGKAENVGDESEGGGETKRRREGLRGEGIRRKGDRKGA